MQITQMAGALLVAAYVAQFEAIAAEPQGRSQVDCAKVPDAQKRLACYDQAANREAAPAPTSQAPAPVRWSGNGITNTRPFHMDGPWEMQWDGKGGFFSAYLYRTGQVHGVDMPNIIANQTGPGTGSSYVPYGGDFYLLVNAMGPWSAKGVRPPE